MLQQLSEASTSCAQKDKLLQEVQAEADAASQTKSSEEDSKVAELEQKLITASKLESKLTSVQSELLAAEQFAAEQFTENEAMQSELEQLRHAQQQVVS